MARLIFLILLVALDVEYAVTVFKGRTARIRKQKGASVDRHQHMGYWFLGLLLAYVVCIDTYVRYIGGTKFDLLFWIHLPLAASLLVTSTLLVFWLNGKKSSRHWFLAYTSVLLMIGVNVTGIPLIWLRF